MFGYIIVNKSEMKFREFDVYHGYYCGLCRKLKEHYGKFGQITLSYDMVFVLMTLTSLYELETTKSMKRCVTHPLQKHEKSKQYHGLCRAHEYFVNLLQM